MSNLFLYHHCSLLHFSLFQPLTLIWNFVRVLWGLERNSQSQRSLSTIYSTPPPLHPSSKSPCSKWGHQQRLRSRVSAAVFPLLLDWMCHTTATAALVLAPVFTSLTGLNWSDLSLLTQSQQSDHRQKPIPQTQEDVSAPISWPGCPSVTSPQFVSYSF